jgi:Tol biopolymer transport system component
MDELRLERALRAGPPFATAYAARPLALDQQIAMSAPARRLLTIVVVAGLLLTAVVAALVIGQLLRKDGPGALAIVREDGIYLVSGDSGELRQILPGVPDGEGGWCPSGPAGACGAARLIDASADGSRLAFTVGREPDQIGFYTTTDLYVVESDGTGLRLVHRDHGRVFTSDPLSPDGRLLAFAPGVGEPSEERTLSIVDLADGQSRSIQNASAPRWSPDGTWIAFSRQDKEFVDTWVMRADGTDQRLVVKGISSADVAWSPDALSLATVRGGHLRIVDTATTDAGPVIGEGLGEVAWSPNGTLIAASTGETLVIITVDGSSAERVVDPQVLGGRFAWSRDGRWLLWSSGHDASRSVMAYDTVERETRALIGRDQLGDGTGLGAPGFILIQD